MQALADVILPVFLVIGFGYVARWRNLITDAQVDGVVWFTQTFAIPCLLFTAISRLDLGQEFDWRLLVSFYTGAVISFGLGFAGARLLFKRDWEDCVAIGFVALFSNTVLLGLPISERAYGPDALAANYAIIALHSPVCYAIGITTMELMRNRGGRLAILAAAFCGPCSTMPWSCDCPWILPSTCRAPVPRVMDDALDMMVRAALPAALFSLGGVLYRYRPEGILRHDCLCRGPVAGGASGDHLWAGQSVRSEHRGVCALPWSRRRWHRASMCMSLPICMGARSGLLRLRR